MRYRADWTPEQSRRNAKHLPGIGVYRHYGGSPQSAVYWQAEGQSHNLSTFIFSLIRAIGLILLGFGVVQVGLSLKSHDPSQRANGFLTLAGGVIITFAKEILDLIMA